MHREITRPSMLLDKNGELIQKGYATTPLLQYSRNSVKNKHRLKEWDYYLIYNKEHALGLTVGQWQNLLLVRVSIVNLQDNKIINKNTIRLVPGKFHLPQDSRKGNIVYKDKLIRLSLRNEGNIRILLLKKYNIKKEPDMEISIVLYNEPKDSAVTAVPLSEDGKHFCYSRKIIGMRASGYVRYKNNNYGFTPTDSFAVANWSRGVWPYKTSWYWCAAAGKIHGKIFGFNLGYCSGDISNSAENMLFYNGTASKLDDVTFHIPKNARNDFDFLKPWTITSSDCRIDMVFVPVCENVFVFPVFPFPLSAERHQVFGKFTGRAILDDGTVIYLKEILGFAEKVEYRW